MAVSLTMIVLLATALLVGVLIGAVGVGGILLIPMLILTTSLPLQAAMATALATFIFTGVFGTVLFQRRGSIDWDLTLPFCVGGAVFGYVGAHASGLLDARTLMQILAGVILVAGLYTFGSREADQATRFESRSFTRRALLFGIGAATGFGSGLTGVGGPALSVPILVLVGVPALTAVGASQVIQIVASLSGSVAHAVQGDIDVSLAAALTVFELVGVWFGVRAAHAIAGRHLRRAVGVLCILVGIGLGVRSIASDAVPVATSRLSQIVPGPDTRAI
jgi:uncharacterized protein